MGMFASVPSSLRKVKVMKISTVAGRSGVFLASGGFLLALLLCGCPKAGEKAAQDPKPKPPAAAEKTPEKESHPRAEELPEPAETAPSTPATESPEKDLSEEMERVAEKHRDYGPPLVERVDDLVRLDPTEPVWVDPQNKQVVLQGEVCRAGYPLEFFATYSNRSYESVTSINVTPSIVHAGLLAVGAEPGHPAKFDPDFVAPTGTEVNIEVRWKDADGNLQSAPAQHWIRNIQTKKELDSNWVFAGASFVTDEETGKRYYTADSGELVCVLSLPNAVLDLPILSYGPLDARLFEAFEEHLPPAGTPITVLLKPVFKAKTEAQKKQEEKNAALEAKRAEYEQQAADAADVWLKLVDGDEYARSWETAAEYLKNTIDRRDFVKALNASRKPLGALESRRLDSKKLVTSVPGAPDGLYVVLQYQSSFADKKSAVETVTPMLDPDGTWRVSGYYIK